MKARRNRIRLQRRRPRIRMVNTFQPVAWIRGRFVDVPLTQELLEDAGVQSAEEWNDRAGAGPSLLDLEWPDQVDPPDRQCRVCGCTDEDCSGCIERTSEPCSWWVELAEHPDGPICSACAIDQVIQGTGKVEPLGILRVSDLVRGPRLRERFRILGWIFRLLRR